MFSRFQRFAYRTQLFLFLRPSEPCQHTISLLPTTLTGQPAWRVGEKEHADSEDDPRKTFHAKHGSPPYASVSKSQVYAIGDRDRAGQREFTEGDKHSSLCRGRDLRNIDRSHQ